MRDGGGLEGKGCEVMITGCFTGTALAAKLRCAECIRLERRSAEVEECAMHFRDAAGGLRVHMSGIFASDDNPSRPYRPAQPGHPSASTSEHRRKLGKISGHWMGRRRGGMGSGSDVLLKRRRVQYRAANGVERDGIYS